MQAWDEEIKKSCGGATWQRVHGNKFIVKYVYITNKCNIYVKKSYLQ